MTGDEDEDDEVEKFREFLDHVSAEDFETKPGETGESNRSSHLDRRR